MAASARNRLGRITGWWPFVAWGVLGAATAVVVPIALARTTIHDKYPRTEWFADPDTGQWQGKDTAGTSNVVMYASTRRFRTFGADIPTRRMPGWFAHSVDGISERAGERTDNYWVEAFGWPAPAMARTLLSTNAGWAQRQEGRDQAPQFFGPGVVGDGWPREILWRGMLLDTALYAGGMVLLPVVFFATRRRVRRARGACVACGYSRAGLGSQTACPECGTPA